MKTLKHHIKIFGSLLFMLVLCAKIFSVLIPRSILSELTKVGNTFTLEQGDAEKKEGKKELKTHEYLTEQSIFVYYISTQAHHYSTYIYPLTTQTPSILIRPPRV